MTEPDDHIAAALAHLAAASAELSAEIHAYPTPISGCDAQFNGLLSDRRRVEAAIRALKAEYFIPTPRAPDALSAIESR